MVTSAWFIAATSLATPAALAGSDGRALAPERPAVRSDVGTETEDEDAGADADDEVVLSLDVDAETLAEASEDSATVTISITDGATFERATDIALTLGGTAAVGADYTVVDAQGRTFGKPFVIALPPGARSITATITAVDDDRDDDGETVTVAASHDGRPVGVTHTVTIIDDDEAPALALSSLRITTTNDRKAYPAFAADTLHYAVGCADGDVLTVTATTENPHNPLSVGGRPTASGMPVTLTGLDGDSDIAVLLGDGRGDSRTYTVHCLPDDYPKITVTKQPGAWEGVFVGSFAIGASGTTPASKSFLQVVDTNGVPRWHRALAGIDVRHFRPQEHGPYPYGYLVKTPQMLVHLDENLNETGRVVPEVWQNRPGWHDAYLDVHDYLNLHDGTAVFVVDDPVGRLVSDIGVSNLYLGRAAADWRRIRMIDEHIVEVSTTGTVTTVWNSWEGVDLHDCTQAGYLAPYAYSHFNSIRLLEDGNYLISLRGCALVAKIDRTTGATVWQLGSTNLSAAEWAAKGLRPPYAIVDDPDGQFCGQHAASLIGNGNLLLYDNGSACHKHPNGPVRHKRRSRVVEYALDHRRAEATLLRSHVIGGELEAFTRWTGWVDVLDNGNWWISWGTADDDEADGAPSVTEVDPVTGERLLGIRFEDASGARPWIRSHALREDEFQPNLSPHAQPARQGGA